LLAYSEPEARPRIFGGKPKSGPPRQTTYDREITHLVNLDWSVDVLTLLRREVGELADQWVDAARHVSMRDVTEESVTFQESPVQKPNSDMVRRFCAYMLSVAQETVPLHAGKTWRAFSRHLYRGKAQRWLVTADGELEREYVPAGAQGGLAGRLGVSVRTLDLYSRIARAAGFFTVRQIKGKDSVAKLPPHLRGEKYSYAVMDWLTALPRAIRDRVKGRTRAANVETPRAELASAPLPAGDELDGLVTVALTAARQRVPRPPD
jgi:hypothetical protein